MEKLNSQSTIYEKMLQNTNIPRENLSKMVEDNVYQTILHGIPFYLGDEYASSSKAFTYKDPRRLTATLCAAYLNKLTQGHTYLHKIRDSTKNVDDRTIITRGNSLHASMTKVLSMSSNLFKEQDRLLDWYEKADGKIVPRVNAHLFYSALTSMNDIRSEERRV